jgi:uncharacterized protein (DUF1501 family)
MNRREFLKKSITLSVVAASFLVGCGGSSSNTGNTLNNNQNNADKSKVLVYLMLGGGNDSFNMLVPKSTTAYNEYANSRSNLAIAQNQLLSLDGFSDKNGKSFGLHPSMDRLQSMFNNDKNVAFIANVGPLIQKVSKTQYQNNSMPIPLGLMSHADQIKHWQTIQANKRTNIGVFGKFADKFQANKADSQISMNISLGGTNILQNGMNSMEYSITKDGSIGLKVKEKTGNSATDDLNSALLDSFNNILGKSYSDSFENTFMGTTKNAQSYHEKFTNETNKVTISHSFTNYDSREDIKFSTLDKSIPEQFKMIAKAIKASDDLGMLKQTFFVDYYGWDHHDELTNNHARMLEVVDNALYDFQKALKELAIEDKVITVVGSDFGRTLTSNGNGTDHGWGGNMFVVGSDIDGGKIYGEYPSLSLNGELDIGGGVLIPTTSIDEVFAEIAYWFGVEKKDLKDYIPNIENFYSLSNQSLPIGFLKS